MSRRVVVNVATGKYYPRGQMRLVEALHRVDPGLKIICWADPPPGSPSHRERPYAFKAYALQTAADHGSCQLLWADASIVPQRPLESIWEYAREHGVWLQRNGWSNAQWTADSAYPDLFPEFPDQETARATNREIPHVVATAFALDLDHPSGVAFLREYYRLASQTRAFCGPWVNSLDAPCGPPEVLGHRHDQTAASVLAWRLGIPLTEFPRYFAYKGGESEEIILVADGNY